MSADISEQKIAYEGNATRSQTKARHDLIPACAEERNALRYGLGAVKHGENNWKSGGKEFIKSCINHMQTHLSKLKKEGNATDDNLGAILWGASSLTWFEENKPEEFAAAIKELN